MRRILPLLLAALTITATSPADASGAGEAEALVRSVYYEGVPGEVARALDGAGIARLGEMLSDPVESRHHGNIVSALGLSEHPAAYALLRAYAEAAPSGEVDRDVFRARSRLGIAFGRLARRDGRALAWLLARARDGEDPVAWSFRHQRGATLRALLEEQALTGLALSGAPAAQPLLDAAASAPGAGVAAERRRAHGRFARELHARTASAARRAR